MELKQQQKPQNLQQKQLKKNKTNSVAVSGIAHDSITDGPGLRLTVFTQGCPHRCKGCHNPETWAMRGGTLYSTEELIAEVQKNPLITGVTFSGGEPMLWAKQLLPFAKWLKEQGIDLAIYTGFLFEKLIVDADRKALLRYASVLVDGPFIESQKSLDIKFKGSCNQRTIDLLKSLRCGKVILNKSQAWND